MVNSGKGKAPMRGPWLIKRATKKGTVTALRFPGDEEREKNKLRERARRRITSNIFAGLRAHGGYGLPSNADNNQVLIALCDEAGWVVDEDGNICRKELGVTSRPFKIENEDRDDNVDLTLSL